MICDLIQSALTYAVDGLFVAALMLPVHHAVSKARAEVRSWGIPMPAF